VDTVLLQLVYVFFVMEIQTRAAEAATDLEPWTAIRSQQSRSNVVLLTMLTWAEAPPS
jgi:hypothetical protein